MINGWIRVGGGMGGHAFAQMNSDISEETAEKVRAVIEGY